MIKFRKNNNDFLLTAYTSNIINYVSLCEKADITDIVNLLNKYYFETIHKYIIKTI